MNNFETIDLTPDKTASKSLLPEAENKHIVINFKVSSEVERTESNYIDFDEKNQDIYIGVNKYHITSLSDTEIILGQNPQLNIPEKDMVQLFISNLFCCNRCGKELPIGYTDGLCKECNRLLARETEDE